MEGLTLISEVQLLLGSIFPQIFSKLPEIISKLLGNCQLIITFLAVKEPIFVAKALILNISPLVIFCGYSKLISNFG